MTSHIVNFDTSLFPCLFIALYFNLLILVSMQVSAADDDYGTRVQPSKCAYVCVWKGRSIADCTRWPWVSHHATLHHHLQVCAGALTFSLCNAYTLLETPSIAGCVLQHDDIVASFGCRLRFKLDEIKNKPCGTKGWSSLLRVANENWTYKSLKCFWYLYFSPVRVWWSTLTG